MKKIISLILAFVFVFFLFSAVLADGKRGDINDNGKIDMTDYILCKRAYFDTFQLDKSQHDRADINNNGIIDMTDYILIKRMYFETYSIPDDIAPGTSESSDAPESSDIPESSEPVGSSEIPDISDDTSEDETVISKVISYDKPYTYSHPLYSNGFGTGSFPNTCLTDGEKEHSKYYDAQYMGFEVDFDDIVTVTIDLEDMYYAEQFVAYTYGGIDGIENPAYMYIEVSENSTKWTFLGEAELFTKTALDDWGNTGTLASYTLTLGKAVSARYVRFCFIAASRVVVMDELEIYGYSKNAQTPDGDDYSRPEDDISVNETGEDILLCYMAQPWADVSIAKNDFLPSVGYYVNGEYVDYMYDSFIFLCSPNYLYNWDSNGAAYLKGMTKSDWSDYITNYEFKANRNINALDAAVGEVKAALGDKNHKAKVYMTLFYPVETVTDFGIVDGKNLDFRNLEDRYLGIKWMVDESVRQFNEHNYENIQLAGFYWFCEEIYDEGGAGQKIAAYITDYIRSLGMKTTWCPYFYAAGYQKWQELGFDIAAMQANYFPPQNNWPNTGGAERLPLVARASRLYNLGVGMELADSQTASCQIFKEYMEAGIEFGFMNVNHIYYMSDGPKVVRELVDSNDTFKRSTYDELYKFIKGDLTQAEIAW